MLRSAAATVLRISIATVSLLYGFMLSELVFQQLRKRVAPDMPTATAATAARAAKLRPQRAGNTRHVAAR